MTRTGPSAPQPRQYPPPVAAASFPFAASPFLLWRSGAPALLLVGLACSWIDLSARGQSLPLLDMGGPPLRLLPETEEVELFVSSPRGAVPLGRGAS